MLNIGKKIMDKKRILILGASSDIGVMTVHKFIKKNWIVIAHYNQNAKKLRKLLTANNKTFNENVFDVIQYHLNL